MKLITRMHRWAAGEAIDVQHNKLIMLTPYYCHLNFKVSAVTCIQKRRSLSPML